MKRWWILAIMAAGQFMFVTDAFVVNVAIPSIQSRLGATSGEIEAVMAVYQIAYASLVVTGGRLGDLFGRRRLFLLGIVAFSLTSAWCGLAQTGSELVLGRLAQGAAAALMVPQVLATIHTLFPDATARARAFAVFGIVLGLGGAFGLILGGTLVTLDPMGLGWRSVFLVNLPAGAILSALTLIFIPHSPRRPDARLDIAGAATLFAALILLIGPLLAGSDLDWTPWLLAPAASGVLLLLGFHVLQRRIARNGGQPLVPPALLETMRFVRGLCTVASFQFGNLAFYLVLTLFIQTRLGYSPMQSGLVVVPLALLFTVASQCAGRWIPRLGVRVLRIGCILQILGVLVLADLVALTPRPGVALLAAVLTLFGFGQGLVMAPLSGLALANIRPDQAGAGSGVLNTVHQAAGAAGIAVVGAVFFAEGMIAALAVLLAAYATTWRLLRDRQPVPSQAISSDSVANDPMVETSTTPEVTAT